jgi:argininosuccinate lyase
VENQKKTVAFAMSVAATLAILDGCLFVYESNFDFISLCLRILQQVQHHVHKKTGCFELIRGKCNKIQALPYEIL